MKKSEVNENMNQKILVCREVVDENTGKKYYYKCPINEDVYSENQYLYKFVMKNEKRELILFQIVDILEDKIDEDNMVELNANELLRPVERSYKSEVPEWMLDELANILFKRAERKLKQILNYLKLDLSIAKWKDIDDERKKYLFSTFGVEDKSDFEQREQSSKERWYREFNKYDMDAQFIINLYELQSVLLQRIDLNTVVSNADKVALKAQCKDEIKKIVGAIFYQENARFQMDSPIGVNEYEKTKELVWAHMSPIEIRIEFSFLWTLVRSILSLAYVPAVMILLENENSKIYMYIILAVVYLVALVFSDEKQVDKLLGWINSAGKEKTGYVDLYYFGLFLTISALLFSLALIQGYIENLMDAVIYLFAGMIIVYGIVVIINVLISLVAWGATLLISIRGVRKTSTNLWKKIKRVGLTIAWVCSICCGIVVASRHNIFEDNSNSLLGGGAFIVAVVGIDIIIIKIVTLWKRKSLSE